MTKNVSQYGEWVLRGLMVLLFTLAGSMKLTAHPFEIHAFAHFGYDEWFMYAIGAIELAGGFALLQRRLMIGAVALLSAVLVGAIASHQMAGDPIVAAVPAMFALALMAGLAVIHWPPHSAKLVD
ncbi:DoxX family protein [Aureimonas glaciei]|uniref:DoxX family protein n=1 Tax=Aureimonas glaciei TaxID=1776957 RepID=A0A916Y2C5_9HYPH|nr:DoxX family protein [Aureimonas glaciei]GGD26282.1 hypothetical protein GCM10011335_31670 [Aureimonas glaciei]